MSLTSPPRSGAELNVKTNIESIPHQRFPAEFLFQMIFIKININCIQFQHIATV